MNPKSLDNLRPFKPGQSGNPSGRPRRKPLAEEYERLLGMRMPDQLCAKVGLPKGASYARGLAKALVDRAIKGDTAAAREITDRIEGKAVARLEHTGAEGTPVELDDLDELRARLRAKLLG